MNALTYYVALRFVRDAEGNLCAGDSKECPTAEAAVREARWLAFLSEGAVAFSRSGDPQSGEFIDAVVLETFGAVLTAEEMLSAE